MVKLYLSRVLNRYQVVIIFQAVNHNVSYKMGIDLVWPETIVVMVLVVAALALA